MRLSTRIPNGAIASVTHSGKRDSNEDRELIVTFPEHLQFPVRAFLAVADGAGGGEAGEAASQLAMQWLQERVNQFVYADLVKFGEISQEQLAEVICDLLKDAIDALHDKIKDAMEMRSATTLTAAFLCDGYFVSAHAGDSRLYVGTRSGFAQLTADQKSEDAGAPYALGSVRVEPDIELHKLYGDDSLLILCTDGVSNVLSEAEMVEILASETDVSEGASALVAEAVERGARDNCTVAMALQGEYSRALPVRGRSRPAAPTPRVTVATPARSIDDFEFDPKPSMEPISYADDAVLSPPSEPPRPGPPRWVPVMLLAAMAVCAAGIASVMPSEWWQVLWPASRDAQEAQVAVGPDVEELKAIVDKLESLVSSLAKERNDQQDVISELQAESEARAGDRAEAERVRRLLAEALESQNETDRKLDEANNALRGRRGELSRTRQQDMQVAEQTHSEPDQQAAEALLARQQSDTVEQQEAERAERARSALPFEAHHAKRQRPSSSSLFNTSLYLRVKGLKSGQTYYLIVGEDLGGRLEVLRVASYVYKNKTDFSAFGRFGFTNYSDRLFGRAWVFFFLTINGYERIGRPKKGDAVSIHYDFLMSLDHQVLRYELPSR